MDGGAGRPFVGRPYVRLKRAPTPGRARIEVSALRTGSGAEHRVRDALLPLPGVRDVEASARTGNALVLFDPDRWTADALLDEIGRALDARPTASELPSAPAGEFDVAVRSAAHGRIRMAVPGLRRAPERERPIEERLRRIAGVESVHANAWTGNVLIQFDPDGCGADELVAAGAELVDSDQAAAPRRYRPLRRRPPAVEVNVEARQADGTAWHAMDVPSTAEDLGANLERGLTSTEARTRLERIGPNRMPEPKQVSVGQLVADQLLNAPTALLGTGAVISALTGGLLEPGMIVAVIGINAAVGATTERTGNRAIAALRASAPIRARVRRDGADTAIDADQLVPGDLIQLLPNDPVPADARVVDAHRLMVEESALTGESRAVEKITEPVDARLTLADRRSMLHRGTTVVGGRGRAVIAETGPRTQIGALHILAAEAEVPQTPLERDLDQLGRWLAVGASSVCVGVAGLGLLYGTPVRQALEVAVSLGVAAIPEGLTALATSVLALASRRMRREGTLIRTLGAAEALGSVTVVCADKTGTLTENRMAAREMFVDGRTIRIVGAALAPAGTFEADDRRLAIEDDPVLRESLLVGVLCSDAELELGTNGELVIDGSATEGALQVAATKAGLATTALREQHPRLDLRDRADGRRHMVTVHRRDDELVAMMKGSPEEVLRLCDSVWSPDGVEPFDELQRSEIGSRNADMAGRAMRVLALARRTLPDGYESDDLGGGYAFLGLIGLVDPVRPAVPSAIKALHRAGIRTVMITGDQALTATAVANELGLAGGGTLHILEAGDLTALNGEALRGLVRDVEIFARVPPEMKLAVVRALQANGNVVAMTGDGVNDGPALRAADVGVAMGERGTELARELADVVLSTDDFTLMVNAVEEGRLVRANVRRVLHYLLSTNLSEIWVVAGAVAIGLPSPLTPLQLLWLNLVTDIAPGLGLAVEPRDPDLMSRAPRDPSEPIIPRPLLSRIMLESAAISVGALGAYGIGIARYGLGPVAQTMAFASLLGAQLLHVLLARAGDGPATAAGPRKNPTLLAGMALSAGLQLVALFVPPVRMVLGGAALPLADLGIAALGAALPILVIEFERIIRSRRPTRTALAPLGIRAAVI